MKKSLCVILLLVVITSVVFAAQPREKLGVGAVVGLPFHIGAAAEYNFGAASAHAALGLYGPAAGATFFLIRAGGDYHFPDPFVHNDWNMELYLSVGGQLDINIGATNRVNMSFPVTWSFFMEDLPVKIFAKAGPEITFGGTGIGFTGSAGAYYLL